MQIFSIAPQELAEGCWRYRALIKASIRREVLGRYRGSFLGIMWSFFNPVFMLIVYTFVFSVVFKARWTVGSESKTEFALVLFAGLIIFNLFAECISRAPGLIITNANYVKKVVYPLEILPWITLGTAAFHGLISIGVWLLAYFAFFGMPHATVLYLPLIMVPFWLFTLGCVWMLASLGVYIRDVSQIVGVMISVLMFLSPLFFPSEALPEDYRPWLLLNPLTPAIEMTRDVLFWGRSPDILMLFKYMVVGAVNAWLGFAWFQRTRKGFADVL